MYPVRRLIAQRRLAMLVCAAALLLKLLVPTGYMIGGGHGRVAISICSGTGPRVTTVDMPGAHGNTPDRDRSKDHVGPELPCAFSGLATAALDATGPIQHVALIAFVMATGHARVIPPPPDRPADLRPPPRGPPASS